MPEFFLLRRKIAASAQIITISAVCGFVSRDQENLHLTRFFFLQIVSYEEMIEAVPSVFLDGVIENRATFISLAVVPSCFEVSPCDTEIFLVVVLVDVYIDLVVVFLHVPFCLSDRISI